MDDLVYSASRYSFFFLLLDWNFSTSNRFTDFVIYPGTFFRYIDPFNSNILFHRINAILDL